MSETARGAGEFSTWKWRAARDHGSSPVPLRGKAHETLDAAYDEAEKWWDAGASRVSVSLWTPDNGDWGLADSRARGDKRGEGWVCGRERWRAREKEAMLAGRA